MSGERASGIPAKLDIPALVMTTVFLTFPDLTSCTTAPRERSGRVIGGSIGLGLGSFIACLAPFGKVVLAFAFGVCLVGGCVVDL